MKICVVDGLSFLGSYVCDQSTKNNHKFVIFDLFHLKWLNVKQQMIIEDVLDKNKLSKVIVL